MATPAIDLVIRNAELGGRRVDIVAANGLITDITLAGTRHGPAADVIDAAGGAVIPGLHDHHLHLLALAAARQSLTFDSDFVSIARLEDLVAPEGEWLRVVGYHESILGEIDRHWLDAVIAHRPVRVQHRTGVMWVLNSAALAAAGIESDTGQLIGADDLLRDRVPTAELDLSMVGRELIGYGVTGVSDMTPYDRLDDMRHLVDAVRRARLPLRVMVTGGAALAGTEGVGLPRGPVKIVVGDHELPHVHDLVDEMSAARRYGRNVAVHCVTRIGLILALAAWEEVGALPGDRIEHGAVVPIELVPTIRDLGLCVVTQPSFITERGDAYLADVEPEDRNDLWRCGSLLRAGVAVGGSTDAPFGNADPWAAILAATLRTTSSGQELGPNERIGAAQALGSFLTHAHDPGGPARHVGIGEIADLCLLHTPLGDAIHQPSADVVRATIVAGRRVTA